MNPHAEKTRLLDSEAALSSAQVDLDTLVEDDSLSDRSQEHPREGELKELSSIPVDLSIHRLNFFYGDHQALRSISLKIYECKVTAVIGPSGCGKSTLLRTFNRMYELYPEQHATGEVLFQNENLLDPRVNIECIRTQIGMVFQKPTPFPMSIYDNVAFGVRLHEALSRRELHHRVEWALDKAGLWSEVKHTLHQSALKLSGGQQQRLCIARCIAVKPKILLFDEPTSSLDPISTQGIEELIVELKKNYTIVIVTHNLQQAQRVSDYAAYMYLGKLIEFNTTEHLFSKPYCPETEEYISGRIS